MHSSLLILLSIISLIPLDYANAAVLLQGPGLLLANYTTCSSTIYDDNALADLLEMENSNQSVRIGNDFAYFVDLACDSDYAFAVYEQCSGLGNTTAECISSLVARNIPKTRHLTRTTEFLQKRNAYFCKDDNCDDTIDANEFGICPSGYTRRVISAPGYSNGIICSKICIASQKAQCLEGACKTRLQECHTYPASTAMCGDALVKYRVNGVSSITINESIYNRFLFPPIRKWESL